jgi:hypothetical protein
VSDSIPHSPHGLHGFLLVAGSASQEAFAFEQVELSFEDLPVERALEGFVTLLVVMARMQYDVMWNGG